MNKVDTAVIDELDQVWKEFHKRGRVYHTMRGVFSAKTEERESFAAAHADRMTALYVEITRGDRLSRLVRTGGVQE